jgi:hypothetical protein
MAFDKDIADGNSANASVSGTRKEALASSALAVATDNIVGAPRPVFAAWDSELFVDSYVSERVQTIIKAKRGGNYGLTAPRGTGKSWLLNQAVEWATKANGLGLLFPSPSKDKPDAFLAALSEVFAQSYMDYYIDKHSRSVTVEGRQRRMLYTTILGLTFYLGIALIILGVLGKHAPKFSGLLYSGIILVVGSMIGVVYTSGLFRRRRTTAYERAVEFRRQARYATVLSNSDELSGGVSRSGASLGFKKSRAEQFTERPVTMSSLVHGFREFCKNVVAAIDGPVVIAIDELDKIENTDDVIELLRAIVPRLLPR